jgi:hypothetical protein
MILTGKYGTKSLPSSYTSSINSIIGGHILYGLLADIQSIQLISNSIGGGEPKCHPRSD